MDHRMEAEFILNALKTGVAPLHGINRLLVDREKAVAAINEVFQTAERNSHVFFIADFFGNGKTFFSHYVFVEALKRNFLVSKVVLDRGINFHLFPHIYRALMEQMTCQTLNFQPNFAFILGRSSMPANTASR